VQIIPAIDLMQGRVVRLTRGDPERATYYDNLGTPMEMAQKWKDQCAERLHIIDLDAAFGRPDNLRIALQIAKQTKLPVQLGGGIRTYEEADRLLDAGIDYVILGSLALKEPEAISKLHKKFSPDRVIVALDNKNGIVMTEGWTSVTAFSVAEALEQYVNLGVDTFLITSISRDGTLSGPDIDTLNEACQYRDVDIIAAGGIGSLKDLVALCYTGVWGAVVGKALYEGKFTLEQAIKTVQKEQGTCH
jgi:phosphoribosylformimino-5-aminoimidazole carboxamide ribotide isomerase